MDELLNKIFQGYPILFAGSGFSYSAKNKKGKNLPVGRMLGNLLASKIDLSPNYELDVLAREYKVSDIGGEHSLYEILRETYTASAISEAQHSIMQLPWKRVYTTNYDNVLQLSSKSAGVKTVTYSAPVDDPPKHEVNGLPIIHLNGALQKTDFRDFDSNIRLTRNSYASTDFTKNEWFAKFTADTSVCSALVFIGYSLYDLDVVKILHSNPTLLRKTYFIEIDDLDPVLERSLSEYGTVLKCGINAFATAIEKYVPPTNLNKKLINFEKVKTIEDPISATTEQVFNLLLYGTYNSGVDKVSTSKGISYAIRRTAVSQIIESVESGEKNVLVHADLGNGKSIIFDQLMWELTAIGYDCLKLITFEPDLEIDIKTLTEPTSRDKIIFVDNFYRHSNTVKKLRQLLPMVPIIGSTRSSAYELNSHKVKEVFDSEFREFDVNRMDASEVTQLTTILDDNGLWADLALQRTSRKENYISHKCNGEIRNVLVSLFEAPAIKEKILKSFQENPNTKALELISVTLMLDIAGFEPDLARINALTGIDGYAETVVINNTFSLEFVEKWRGKIQVKSAVFGQWLIQNVIDKDYALKLIIKLIRRCDELGATSRGEWREMLKALTRFSFIDRLFKRETAGQVYKQFYDSLKDLPSLKRDPQFWLQFAIAHLELHQYNNAKIHFDTSYSLSKKFRSYDRRMIDNHYAKFLLLSRLNDASNKDQFSAFSKAHNLLILQARKEKNVYFPYKVARFYKPFYERFFDNFSRTNKDTFFHAIEELLVEAETVANSALKYMEIEQFIDEANLMIAQIEKKL